VFCPKCGTALAEGAYFCPKCGAENTPGAVTPPLSTSATIPGTPVQPQQTSGMAIGSLICGLVPFLILTPIAAIVLGHLALSQIKHSAGRLKGKGMAIAGLVLGYGCVAVLPLILIIAAIAIPNLLHARIAANEAAAASSVRTLVTAEITYAEAHGDKGFTCSLDDLKNTGIISGPITSGSRSGYVFELVGCKAENPDGPNTQFQVIAYPITKNTTGTKAFCADQTNLVRYVANGSGEDCLDHGKNIGE
jgi:type II secretory pathway pseudopilin PulG